VDPLVQITAQEEGRQGARNLVPVTKVDPLVEVAAQEEARPAEITALEEVHLADLKPI